MSFYLNDYCLLREHKVKAKLGKSNNNEVQVYIFFMALINSQ